MIYLYLTKRDKKDMKLVTMFQGEFPASMRVENLTSLDLPPTWHSALKEVVDQERMHYELWIESADDMTELQKRLRGRGYKNLPIITAPLVLLGAIPTGVEDDRGGRLFKGAMAPSLCPIAVKKMHLAHQRLRRVTP